MTRVIVVVEGGVVRDVFSDDPTLNVDVLDHDERDDNPNEASSTQHLIEECGRLFDVMGSTRWVFLDENDKVVGTAPPNRYVDAEHALRDFAKTYGDHFGVYFQKGGVLHSCDPESRPEDF